MKVLLAGNNLSPLYDPRKHCLTFEQYTNRLVYYLIIQCLVLLNVHVGHMGSLFISSTQVSIKSNLGNLKYSGKPI